MTKNVPCARWRRSTSSSRGVHSGSGPSSNVSAIVFAGIRWLRAWPDASTCNTGPPFETSAGTPVAEPAVPRGALRSAPTWRTYPLRHSSASSRTEPSNRRIQCARGSRGAVRRTGSRVGRTRRHPRRSRSRSVTSRGRTIGRAGSGGVDGWLVYLARLRVATGEAGQLDRRSAEKTDDDHHQGQQEANAQCHPDDREQSTAASRPVDEHGHGHERSTSPRDIRSPSTERAARRGRAIPTPEPTQSRASSEDGVCDMAAAGARTAVRGAGVYCVERYGDRRLARTTAT